MARVLAIDPSINNIGWAVAENGKLLESGLIKTQGKIDAVKLCNIEYQLEQLFMRLQPQHYTVYIEDLYIFTRRTRGFKNLNLESVMQYAKAYGMIEKVLCDWGIVPKIVSKQLARKEKSIAIACRYLTGWHEETRKHNKGKLRGQLYGVPIKANGDELTDHEAEAICWAIFYSRQINQ